MLNPDIQKIIEGHNWVEYYDGKIDVAPKDREWAERNTVYRCTDCGIWVWKACK